MVVEKMKRKEHLTPEGLKKIVAIRASMNLGLSDKLQLTFPDVVSVERFLVEIPQKIDPQWLAGFTSAEGCFMVRTIASKTHFKGFQVRLEYQVTQHIRDEKLIRWIRDYLNCGHVYRCRVTFDLRVSKFDDITLKIIPFFQKHPIHGVKALDFADWCQVAEMMKQKKHLTAEGLEKIKQIKAGMNRGRNLY